LEAEEIIHLLYNVSESFSPYYRDSYGTESRYYHFDNQNPFIVLTKELDQFVVGLDLYEPEFQIIEITDSSFVKKTINPEYFNSFDQNIVAPLDGVFYNSDEIYFYSRANYNVIQEFQRSLCKHTISTDKTECISNPLREVQFYQNHLNEMFFTSKDGGDTLFQLQSDLSFSPINTTTDFLDLKIFDQDKLVLCHIGGFDFYNHDFSMKLDSIDYPMEGKEFAVFEDEILVNEDGTVLKLDLAQNITTLYENECSNHRFNRISINNDHAYIYGGKDYAMQVKAIDLDPEISNNNYYGLASIENDIAISHEIIFQYIYYNDPVHRHKLTFEGEIILTNTGTMPIESVELRLGEDSTFPNEYTHKYFDLNLQPNESMALEIETEILSKWAYYPGDILEEEAQIENVMPDSFNLEVIKLNQFFPCDEINFDVDTSSFIDSLLSNNNEFEISTNIYPNPVSDFVYVQSDFENLNFELYDSLGNIVDRGQCDKEIDMAGLPPSIYFLKLINEEDLILTERLIKI